MGSRSLGFIPNDEPIQRSIELPTQHGTMGGGYRGLHRSDYSLGYGLPLARERAVGASKLWRVSVQQQCMILRHWSARVASTHAVADDESGVQ